MFGDGVVFPHGSMAMLSSYLKVGGKADLDNMVCNSLCLSLLPKHSKLENPDLSIEILGIGVSIKSKLCLQLLSSNLAF